MLKNWIQAHKEIRLLALYTPLNLKNYTCFLECYPIAYLKKEPFNYKSELNIRIACIKDLSFILNHYTLLEEWEIRKIISMNHLFIGYKDNIPVGFIGLHLEGSMGLLYILKEYRGNGYGIELEMFLVNRLLFENKIPFGQLETENNHSIFLQKKLGFTFSTEKQFGLNPIYNEFRFIIS
ncbi:MAG: GNAT family N-acetyltransferase [Floccifex porci]|nr:GNAT family N-acetyltransferase [Floccifex porci]MDY4797689.1 GNAT family N-acetyltransferase [Floccifex porci]